MRCSVSETTWCIYWPHVDIYIYLLWFQQEPGADGTEILQGLKYVRPGGGYTPNFQMFSKIDVNGDEEDALYTYLKVDISWFNTN